MVWDVDAAGSNPVTPTKMRDGQMVSSHFFFKEGDRDRACLVLRGTVALFVELCYTNDNRIKGGVLICKLLLVF